MKTYYAKDCVLLYHGDCLDHHGGDYDLIVTDPPYGAV